jgi:GNAT superfamily N-acetyltransferase
MPSPSIRPFASADAPDVEAILQASWHHDPTMLGIYRMHAVWESDLIRQTLVAEIGGVVVGAGTLFESTIHPRMLFLNINVAPTAQRQGVGTALYDALQALHDARPWQTKMTRRDRAGMAFLTKRGYRVLVTQINGVIDPATDETRAWLATLPAEVPGYRIVPITDEALMGDVAQTLFAVYSQYHTWNPPAPLSAERIRQIFLGPTTIPGAVLGVYQGDALIGAATLFIDTITEGAVNDAYLVHLGIVGSDHPASHSLTTALIRREIEIAGNLGMRVRFEADDTYLPHHAILETAPTVMLDRDFVLLCDA